MEIIIYTKSQCPNCVSAKTLLKLNGLAYEERDIEDPSWAIEFFTYYPGIRQMPQIFIDNQRVGGLAGLQAALAQIRS